MPEKSRLRYEKTHGGAIRRGVAHSAARREPSFRGRAGNRHGSAVNKSAGRGQDGLKRGKCPACDAKFLAHQSFIGFAIAAMEIRARRSYSYAPAAAADRFDS